MVLTSHDKFTCCFKVSNHVPDLFCLYLFNSSKSSPQYLKSFDIPIDYLAMILKINYYLSEQLLDTTKVFNQYCDLLIQPNFNKLWQIKRQLLIDSGYGLQVEVDNNHNPITLDRNYDLVYPGSFKPTAKGLFSGRLIEVLKFGHNLTTSIDQLLLVNQLYDKVLDYLILQYFTNSKS